MHRQPKHSCKLKSNRLRLEQLESKVVPSVVTGDWKGTWNLTFPYSQSGPLTMQLKQSQPSNSVDGEARWIIGGVFDVKTHLTGDFDQPQFSFQEDAVLSSNLPQGYTWEFAEGDLLMAPDGETMTGPWSDTANSSGTFQLTRIDRDDQIDDPANQVVEAIDLGVLNKIVTPQNPTAIEWPKDVDMFKFKIETQQRIAFDIDNPTGSELESSLQLFDANGVLVPLNPVFDVLGGAPREIDELNHGEAYIEHTFAIGGTYYVAVSGAGNTTYNAKTGKGDTAGSEGQYSLTVTPVTRVTSGLKGGSIITGEINMPNYDAPGSFHRPSINVSLRNYGTGAIKQGVNTWIIVHGRGDSWKSFAPLGGRVDLHSSGDQVLLLDWQEGAADNSPSGFAGGAWIEYVGDWAAGACRLKGISGSQLRGIGHSWGSYVVYEIGERDPLKAIVALDPALLAGEYPFYNVDFGRVSSRAWAFWGSGDFGSAFLAGTADEAFMLEYSSVVISPWARHQAPVAVFTRLVQENLQPPTSARSRLFSLNRLLNPSTRPWRDNAYLGIFEGVLRVNISVNGYVCDSFNELVYKDNATGIEVYL